MASTFVAVIQKIKFGDETGVYSETYRDEFRSNPDWQEWNTPVRFESGWMLLLYDPVEKAITVTADIERVTRSGQKHFRWCNTLVPDKIKVDPEIWIPLNAILTVPALEKFCKGPRPYWYISEKQRDQLLEDLPVT